MCNIPRGKIHDLQPNSTLKTKLVVPKATEQTEGYSEILDRGSTQVLYLCGLGVAHYVQLEHYEWISNIHRTFGCVAESAVRCFTLFGTGIRLGFLLLAVRPMQGM